MIKIEKNKMKAKEKKNSQKAYRAKDKTVDKKSDPFAVFRSGGKQYLAKPQDILLLEKINGRKGDKIKLEEILLYYSGKELVVGKPLVKEKAIEAKIISQEKGDKVRIFKMKPKKRYRKLKGHRQNYTKVKIEKI